jgi:hypothetical protein
LRLATLLIVFAAGCREPPPRGLVAEFGGLREVPAERFVGGKGPYLMGEARLTNHSADTVALALSGEVMGYHSSALLPPDSTGAGWFALVFGRDTVRLASDSGHDDPSPFPPNAVPLLLAPGDSAVVRVRTPNADLPPGSPPLRYQHSESELWAFIQRVPKPELIYAPNPRSISLRERSLPWVDTLVHFRPVLGR